MSSLIDCDSLFQSTITSKTTENLCPSGKIPHGMRGRTRRSHRSLKESRILLLRYPYFIRIKERIVFVLSLEYEGMNTHSLCLSALLSSGGVSLWFLRQRKKLCYAHVILREMKLAQDIINY